MEKAAKDVRGMNRVVDQDPEGKYEALSRYVDQAHFPSPSSRPV
jgi:hypothetical protein